MNKQEIKARLQAIERELESVAKSSMAGDHLLLVQISLRLEQLVLLQLAPSAPDAPPPAPPTAAAKKK